MKPSPCSWPRQTLLSVLTASVFAFPAAKLAAQSSDTSVVELPKFEVEADRILPPLEKWHYVSIPGYEILSNSSKYTTRRFVREFYLLQQVAQVLLPRAKSVSPLPTYIVLCDRGNAFSHFMPQTLAGSESEVRSLFYDDQERTAIIADLSPGQDDEHTASFDLLNEQYFRQIVRRNLGKQAPYWLEEGLCRLFADVNFTTDWVEFGKIKRPGFGFSANLGFRNHRSFGWDPFGIGPNRGYDGYHGSLHGYGAMYGGSPSPFSSHSMEYDWSGAYFDRDWDDPYSDNTDWRTFRSRYGNALIPLKDFFAITDSTEASKKYGRSFSNQAYLFVHMCLYGRGLKHQPAFAKLVERSLQGPITEDIFQECFGVKFSSFGIEMRGYTQFADHRYEIFSGTDGRMLAKAPPFELRPATEAESGRIAGEVLRLAGHRKAALDRLIAPYVRGDRSPDLLAALGLAELWADQTDRGRKFLEAAVAGKTTRARAYVELGHLRFQEMSAKAAAENRRLTDEEVAFVMAPLKAGFQHPPTMPDLYQVLAHTWFRSATPPTLADYKVLLGGAYRYPRDLRLIYNLAAVGVVNGFTAESRPLVEHGLHYAQTDHAKKNFALLASKLPSSPAPAPAP
jgi:hypothetical protein